MSRRMFFILVWLAAMSLVIIALAIGSGTPRSATPTTQQQGDSSLLLSSNMPALTPSDIATGEHLYAQHCASCHGVTLQGQPNWKVPLANGTYLAPPHDDSGHTWHHADGLLLKIILNGGGAGDGDMTHGNMPAFKDKLSEQHAAQILAFFKSRWSAQHRAYQFERTLQGN